MVGVVFPVSMWLLLVKVLRQSEVDPLWLRLYPAFSAFPWYFLVFGPLYSNLAAFAVVPIAMFITITVVESCCLGHVGIRDGLIVLAMVHPLLLSSQMPSFLWWFSRRHFVSGQ